MTPATRADAGLKVIVRYKLVKAVAEIVLGLLLLLTSARLLGDLRELALMLREHATEAWSLALAGRMVRAATGRHVAVVGVASLLDGVSSSVEGWALHRRYRWSRWLVVIATGCLLPFEGVELVRRVTAGRIAFLFVNAAIVLFLLRHRVAPRTQHVRWEFEPGHG